jgi:hypothetical protein
MLANARNQNTHDATRLAALRRYRALLDLPRRFVVYVEDLLREQAFERLSCPKDGLLLERRTASQLFGESRRGKASRKA